MEGLRNNPSLRVRRLYGKASRCRASGSTSSHPVLAPSADIRAQIRDILKLSLPISLDLAILFLTFFIDTYCLSLHSQQAAAAVGALFALFGLAGMTLRQVAQAGAVIIAHQHGAGDEAGRLATGRAMLGNGLALGLALAGLVWLGAEHVPHWLGLREGAAATAGAYMLGIAPGLVPLSLKYTFAGLTLAAGNARPQMHAAIFAVAINIVLNAIALRSDVFGRSDAGGAAGVALATAVSYGVNAAVLWYFIGDKPALLRRSAKGELAGALQAIWRKALPTTLEPAAIQLQGLILTGFVAALGIASLAARIYVLNFEMFVLAWSLAIAIAVQIQASHAMGAGNPGGADAAVRIGNGMGAIGAAILMLVMYLGADTMLGWFTADRSVIATARVLFMIAIPTEMAKAVYNTSCWALVGCGDHRFPVLASAAALFGIGVPLAWYLSGPAGLGIAGIWLALAVDEALRAMMMALRWRRLRRRQG